MSNYQVTVCDAHDHKVRIISHPATLEIALYKAQIAERAAVDGRYQRAVVILDPDKEARYTSVVDKEGVITSGGSVADTLKKVMDVYKDPTCQGACSGYIL